MSPISTEESENKDELRVVLTWTGEPSDLDSHLFGPIPNDYLNRFHVYFSNKTIEHEDSTYAYLDVDDTDYEGPETVTVYKLDNRDVYSYYIHNYSELDENPNDTISKSGARIDVYIKGQYRESFFAPVGVGGTLWHVFDYNAATDTLLPVNEMSYQSNEDFNDRMTSDE